MSSGESRVSRGRLDVASQVFNGVVVSVACLVFFDSFTDVTVGLSRRTKDGQGFPFSVYPRECTQRPRWVYQSFCTLVSLSMWPVGVAR